MSIGWAPAPARLWRGARGLWEVVIGLEVHSAVAARTKLLSAASASGAGAAAPSAPNAAVSLFDAAHPGTLPSPSGACVEAAVRAAAALACAVAPAPAWSRKHYHYADLPHGFQVTHAGEQALATDGALDVDVPAAAQAAAPAPVAAPAAAGVRRRGGGGASAPAPAPAAAPPVAAAAAHTTQPIVRPFVCLIRFTSAHHGNPVSLSICFECFVAIAGAAVWRGWCG